MLLPIGQLGLVDEAPDSVGTVQRSFGGGTSVASAPDVANVDSSSECSFSEDQMVELIEVGDTAADPNLNVIFPCDVSVSGQSDVAEGRDVD